MIYSGFDRDQLVHMLCSLPVFIVIISTVTPRCGEYFIQNFSEIVQCKQGFSTSYHNIECSHPGKEV